MSQKTDEKVLTPAVTHLGNKTLEQDDTIAKRPNSEVYIYTYIVYKSITSMLFCHSLCLCMCHDLTCAYLFT